MDPVFIVGVPRSGTTLLRVILDSHPNLAVGPECPWISGNYGEIVSFKHLFESLTFHVSGPTKTLNGANEKVVASALGHAIDEILQAYAKNNGKSRWIEKTPDNIAFVPFLNTIFLDAKYIHIIRDGRDVAISSFQAKHKWGTHINCNGERLENNILNCLKRWDLWINQFQDLRKELSLNVIELKYEELIDNPSKAIGDILDFIGEPWSDDVLNYLDHDHDLPENELGTEDVIQKKKFSKESLGRWKKQFSLKDKIQYKKVAGQTLKRLGYL